MGLIHIRILEAARENAAMLANSNDVIYLPKGMNVFIGLNPRQGQGGLTFTEEDERGVYYPHNDAVVIIAWVGISRVQRILIDTGSSACILFSGCYSVMNLDDDLIQEDDIPIIGFKSNPAKKDRQTLASLRKQLKRKHPTFNDSDQGMNPGNLGSIGGDHEDTGGDIIIPTESEKSESEAEYEEETLDDLEIKDLEILALEKSDWRLPFIEYLNSGNLPIEKALSQKVK
ncbi:hypothetical protein IFM89_014330 [Coptis chinensis]|uniref:Uncharacterized protein n=1 Tax=Coptis chinensis TaxID=261450 RepID=A0A835HVZ4_9MAGN|nr:hypothetical protein IFM89_014330 [Coptis chinensis]